MWTNSLTRVKYRRLLDGAQRRCSFRICREYLTVSAVAARIIPLKLLPLEVAEVLENGEVDRLKLRERTIDGGMSEELHKNMNTIQKKKIRRKEL